MSPKVLITGAAGYIGGSILADFLSHCDTLFKKENISAAVRSEKQAEAISKLGINVFQLDLSDESAVVESLLRHDISIVIQCTTCINPAPALNLITALGKRREANGGETYFVHTSGLSAFFASCGWPHGEIKDTDSVFDLEKEAADSFPVRQTDVAIIEHAQSREVTSFLVFPTLVYGRGKGEWNKLSVQLPAYVRASISDKVVHKFADNTRVSAIHISDLTAFYRQLVKKILRKETLPSGKEGYYFALAHDFNWLEALDQMAVSLKSRGLLDSSKTQIWPSDEVAGASLKFPAQYVQALWNSGAKAIAENKHKLGWVPAWDEKKFLESMDEEIQDVLEFGERKSSFNDSVANLAQSYPNQSSIES
ncbi:NAD(P)-binding protein [Melanomma pulvis-pyrius CBS 109.77]|uniref:NAD(P)-binding protein n=1 Tax=Melanomma pulvis-pyrius CBS 109.77 TaxID=1314802 RepID=A0A6A6XD71_9PLEO|nr:NAD(P)-binding protein [Melanomma pulvis-pyrius CBS 109.77]